MIATAFDPVSTTVLDSFLEIVTGNQRIDHAMQDYDMGFPRLGCSLGI